MAAEFQHRQWHQKHATLMMLKEKSCECNGMMRKKCCKEMHEQLLKVPDKISKGLNKLSVDNEDHNKTEASDNEFIELISGCTGQSMNAVTCHACREIGLPYPNPHLGLPQSFKNPMQPERASRHKFHGVCCWWQAWQSCNEGSWMTQMVTVFLLLQQPDPLISGHEGSARTKSLDWVSCRNMECQGSPQT